MLRQPNLRAVDAPLIAERESNRNVVALVEFAAVTNLALAFDTAQRRATQPPRRQHRSRQHGAHHVEPADLSLVGEKIEDDRADQDDASA